MKKTGDKRREVRKFLFKNGDGECNKSDGGWPESIM